MKQLQDRFPDELITLSMHRSDALQSIESSSQPEPSAGAPSLIFDRKINLKNFPDAAQALDDCLDMLAPAQIDVDIYWTSPEKEALRAEAKVKFVDDADPDRYLITYALVEDKMSDPSWKQRNFFWNADSYTDAYYQEPYWDLFIGQPLETEGIVYDDITMLFNDCHGIAGSLPSAIVADEVYTHDTTLRLSDAKCAYDASVQFGKPLIKNPDNLRVVAVIVDTESGVAVNANTSRYAADAEIYYPSTNVDALTADTFSEVVSIDYYTLSGVRIAGQPAAGAYIAVKHLANGDIITAKYLQ